MRFQRISRERICPECKSSDVYRLKRTGFSLRVLCRILNLRPHWCAECDAFFLGPRGGDPPRSQRPYESGGSATRGGNLPHAGGLAN
jgi:hypothetical protein